MQRKVRLLWVLVSSIAGLCIGAAIALTLATWVFKYAQDSAALADATLAVSTLEHLSSNDIKAATEMARLQLRASLDTLADRGSDLTPEQQKLLSTIRRKAEPFVNVPN